jgi:hypothetical protein
MQTLPSQTSLAKLGQLHPNLPCLRGFQLLRCKVQPPGGSSWGSSCLALPPDHLFELACQATKSLFVPGTFCARHFL